MDDYLGGLVREGIIAPGRAEEGMVALRVCREAFPWLPDPDMAPGNDGELLLYWRDGHLYISLELSGDPSWFYRDGASGEIWGEEYVAGCPASIGLRDRMVFFGAGRGS